VCDLSALIPQFGITPSKPWTPGRQSVAGARTASCIPARTGTSSCNLPRRGRQGGRERTSFYTLDLHLYLSDLLLHPPRRGGGRAGSLEADGRPSIHGNCTNPECTGGFAGRRGEGAYGNCAPRDAGGLSSREESICRAPISPMAENARALALGGEGCGASAHLPTLEGLDGDG
jgi:hypothetical protein